MSSAGQIVPLLSLHGDRIRNVCILAHVDHGKTSLADALLATNGIISFRQAGKLRYMDSTEAEQVRGITMKSSAASLVFNPTIHISRQISPQVAAEHPDSHLVNLIDSPGHVDFASDVSTAVRLCDGAIIVVDVVEGVCPQTRTVLRQAWNERLTLILIFNKLDRLFLQLGFNPMQVYDRLLRVLEQVNSVLAEMFTADVLQQNYESTKTSSLNDQSACGTYKWSTGLEKTDDSNVYFSPDRGNVIFASAVDGWGFRISDFAEMWAEKMKVPKKGLQRALWGDYYFAPSKAGGPPKVKCNARANNKKPVFVQLVLNQLYNLYKTLIIDANREKASHIAGALGVNLEPRLLQRVIDDRTVLYSILSAWQPLGPALFRTVIEICPSPLTAISRARANYMLFGESGGGVGIGQSILEELEESGSTSSGEDEQDTEGRELTSSAFPAISALQSCSAEADAPVIIFVSKVFWTDKQNSSHSTIVFPKDAPRAKLGAARREALRPTTAIASKPATLTCSGIFGTEFVALSRIYSGQVYIGQRLFVLGPKFDGSKIPEALLDADPAEFPLGPLHLPELEQEPDKPLFASPRGRHRSGSTSSSRSHTNSISDGSFDGSVGSVRALRHVYVAEICDVVQFNGGQNNVTRLSDPCCPLTSLSAGNVVGLISPSVIASLPKSGLLVSCLRLVASSRARRVLPLAGLTMWQGAPVVSLALEPASATNPDDMVRLETGLRLLERSDPCAEVTISSKGEYLLHAAGEIHMQKCLEDLTKHFAPDLEFHTSPFVVPFRETITEACPEGFFVPFDSLAFAKAQLERELKEKHLVYDDVREHCVRVCATEGGASNLPSNSLALPTTPNAFLETADPTRYLPLGMLQLPHSKSKTRVFIRVSAHPIPEKLIAWLETRAVVYVPHLLRFLKHRTSRRSTAFLKKFDDEFAQQLESILPDESPSLNWPSLKDRLLCLGPQQIGPNLLFSRLRSGLFRLDTAWGRPMPPWTDIQEGEATSSNMAGTGGASQIPFLSYGKALLRGFQVATEQGPLCAEPMRGVAFVLEEIFAEERVQLQTPNILSTSDLLTETAEKMARLEIEKKAMDERESKESVPPKTDVVLEPPPPKADDADDDNDPILAAIKAKQAAVQMHQNAQRLASLSWLNNGDDDDDDDDDDDSNNYDYGSGEEWGDEGDSSSDEHTNKKTRDDECDYEVEEEEEPVVQPDKRLTLSTYYYWQRRTDNEWLSDVIPGLLTPAMVRACTSAYQACPGQRLVLSMYDIELQCRGDMLGRMYVVLRKRFGRVISEDMREGEECFSILARLSVIESFGLTNDLRKSTSGLVSLPQLRPGGWEILDIDPLQRDATGKISGLCETHIKTWQRQQEMVKKLKISTVENTAVDKVTVSSSDSEDEEGLMQDEVNNQLMRLRGYIREVRKRKGLNLHEQLVVSADKQRTLKKNK